MNRKHAKYMEKTAYPPLRGKWRRLMSVGNPPWKPSAQTLRNVTDHKVMDEASSMDKEFARLALSAIGDSVLCADIEGRVSYLNAVAEKMTGWTLAEARGQPFSSIFRIMDGTTGMPRAEDPVRHAIKYDKSSCLPPHSVIVRRDGTQVAVEDSVAPIHGKDGGVIGAIMVCRDVSATRAEKDELRHRAQHDFLTDLPNAVLLNDRITQAIAMARRYGKELAVLFMDLDDFKMVNDTRGHAIGDQLLQSVASRLKASIRNSDTVSRKGGDEFVILLSEITHAEHAARSARKIIAAMTAVHRISGLELPVAASIGISIYPLDGQDADSLLKSADHAMYQAKKRGHNQYCFSQAWADCGAVA